MFTSRGSGSNPRHGPRGESAGNVWECETRRIRPPRRKPAKMTAQPPRAAPAREPAAAPGRKVARHWGGRRRRDARAVPRRSGRCGMPSRRSGAQAGEHAERLGPLRAVARRSPCSPRGGRRGERIGRHRRRGESMPPKFSTMPPAGRSSSLPPSCPSHPNRADHPTDPAPGTRAVAQAILRREGIDINEAANGVFLPANKNVPRPPATVHAPVHTKVYYRELTRRLRAAAPGTIRDVLADIATELLNGTFPL